MFVADFIQLYRYMPIRLCSFFLFKSPINVVFNYIILGTLKSEVWNLDSQCHYRAEAA